MLIYFIKVNIAIALFYLFYRLFFASDTLWRTRRIYLLVSIAVSFLYPMLHITAWLEKQPQMQTVLHNYVQLQEVVITPETHAIDYSFWLYSAYWIIAAVFMIRFGMQLFSILKIRLQSQPGVLNGVNVRILQGEQAPFSFFGIVFINPALHSEFEQKQILTHELTHVRQRHSIDVIVAELLTVVCWINPVSWLLKREIRQNLEFLADDKVIASGVDSRSYQYHLLQLSYQVPRVKIINQFNISPLKKRITMMNQKKSSKSTALKYLLIAPLTLSLVVVSNAETIVSKAKNMLQESKPTTENVSRVTTQKQDVKASDAKELTVVGYGVSEQQAPKENSQKAVATSKDDDPVFQVVENMPKFPGGDQALFKFLAENVRYPVTAQEKGIQGRVICSFIINKDGSVSDVEVVRSVDSFLDAEAMRVIKTMPEWEPGTQRGKTVRVKYNLPINFKLDGGKDTKNPWGDKPIVLLDGMHMPPNFDYNIIKTESIEKIEVLKPDTEEKKADLISKYGKYAGNGVILITTKK
ncbi:MAG: TonB family protein [Paludibacter sp.]|nr:TonB family protein [Paludibacter sp.]